eukprot:TRINITY_DN4963_c0_g2_i1.p1 TRINITY_DN4963_c0_g2~~TRINITY_DN4963_c0_g2_i1.p1  ORF type:complete len:507 (-),score=88.62 TRINITY_DN4963_c0_g2_i1:42-1562(-)
MKRVFVVLVAAALVAAAQAFSLTSYIRLQNKLAHGDIQINNQIVSEALPAGGNDPQSPHLFEQKLDHFNHQDDRTWRQQFYYNDSNWRPNGPIFFQLGGESSVWSSWQSGMQIGQWAPTFGALYVILEHRYYGFSWPTNNTETENLQWLSTEQALADAAYFIQWFKQNMSSPDSPVITFGGSYSGNLAAWLRLKYPHVTIAAVASSAPVLAVVDFYQYVQVVDRSLSVLGGSVCDSVIRNATQEIQTLLKIADGQQQLAKLFNWCSPIRNTRDINTFMSILMGAWEGAVQYNGESPGSKSNIDYMCGQLEKGASTPLKTYINFMNEHLDPFDCLNISYVHVVEGLSRTVNDIYSPYTGRHWFYQTCSEFGYYQTTDGGDAAQPFGNLVPLEYWLGLCKDVFGRPFETFRLAAEKNLYYGGNNLDSGDGTNVLFVNGNVDPWSALSITESLDDSLTAIFINGTAHCADMLVADKTSPVGLVDAQTKIGEQIGSWLVKHRKRMAQRRK